MEQDKRCDQKSVAVRSVLQNSQQFGRAPLSRTKNLYSLSSVENAISIRSVTGGRRFETPIDLRGKKIQLRHERHRQGAVIVYDQGRRIGKARLLDAVANGLARRKEA